VCVTIFWRNLLSSLIWTQKVPPKHWYLSTRLWVHSITFQQAIILIKIHNFSVLTECLQGAESSLGHTVQSSVTVIAPIQISGQHCREVNWMTTELNQVTDWWGNIDACATSIITFRGFNPRCLNCSMQDKGLCCNAYKDAYELGENRKEVDRNYRGFSI
jgi:hypothetical protein